jgi:hypothetical protein
MLDVHPPHHAAHTWTDFFIHIATIVIGLLIAVGLEQTVEAFHHNQERHQLREDLRAEAELRIQRLQLNERINAADVTWYRSALLAGRQATFDGKLFTYTMPPRPSRHGYITEIPTGVWPAAKASGTATVLPAEEIELWDSIDSSKQTEMKSFDSREEALKLVFAFAERKAVSINPGQVLHLTPDEMDEFQRAISRLVEETWMLERDEAHWEGACDAVLHGAKTSSDLTTAEGRAVATMPK